MHSISTIDVPNCSKRTFVCDLPANVVLVVFGQVGRGLEAARVLSEQCTLLELGKSMLESFLLSESLDIGKKHLAGHPGERVLELCGELLAV